MSTLFECLMISSFCIAMAIQLFRYARNKATAGKKEMFMLVTMEIGFIVGAVKTIFVPFPWLIIFYGIGALLTFLNIMFATLNNSIEKAGKYA